MAVALRSSHRHIVNQVRDIPDFFHSVQRGSLFYVTVAATCSPYPSKALTIWGVRPSA
jgi:hypothetical protein